jgi:hypothetical protein
MIAYRIPGFRTINNSTSTTGVTGTNLTVIDAVGEGIGIICQLNETDTITDAAFRLAAKTNPTGTVQISLQTVGTDGKPTGTILGSGTATGTTNSYGAIGTWVNVTLGTPIQITRGDIFAIVIEAINTGTWGGSNQISITHNIGSLDEGNVFPYYQTLAAGAWTANTVRNQECYRLKSATRTYGIPLLTTEAQDSITSSLEVGVKFNVPLAYGRFFRVVGVNGIYRTQNIASTIDYTINLYDWNNGANSTALQTVQNNNQRLAQTTTVTRGAFETYFNATDLALLETNKDYILSLSSASATVGIQTNYLGVDDVDKDAWFRGTWDYCSRTSSTGSWSTTANRWPWFELLIEDVTQMLVHPGMTGGIRG